MATSMKIDAKAVSTSNVDILLHPELLSQDFMELILTERNVSTTQCEGRDRLTELYLRHVIPLPQRTLPDSRWGRRARRSRGAAAALSSSNDLGRKRPLIVFDGSSSHSAPLKVKKPEGTTTTGPTTERLKPPPAANPTNPIRKIASSSSSSSVQRCTDSTNLKRETNSLDSLESPDVKRKIQHVTWP